MTIQTRKISSHIRIGDNDTVKNLLTNVSVQSIEKKVLEILFKVALEANNPDVIYMLNKLFSSHTDFFSCLEQTIDQIPSTVTVESSLALLEIYKTIVDKTVFQNRLDLLLYKAVDARASDFFSRTYNVTYNTSVLEMLILQGADVNKSFSKAKSISTVSLPVIMPYHASDAVAFQSISTAFALAIMHYDTGAAIALLESEDFDPTKHQSKCDADSILAKIIEMNSLSGLSFDKSRKMSRPALTSTDVNLLKTFLGRGGDPNFFLEDSDVTSISSITPLSLAASNNDYESFMILLQAGADPLLQHKNGIQLKDIAKAAGNADIAKELEQRTGKTLLQKNIVAKDKSLIKAIKNNSVKEINIALNNGANINFIDRPNKNKISAFTYAVSVDADIEVFKALFDAGLDPNQQDRYGNNAFNIIPLLLLKYAERRYRKEIVRYNGVIINSSEDDDATKTDQSFLNIALAKTTKILDMSIKAGLSMNNVSYFASSDDINKSIIDGSHGSSSMLYIMSSGLPFALLNVFDYETYRKNHTWGYADMRKPFNFTKTTMLDATIAKIFNQMFDAGLDPNMKTCKDIDIRNSYQKCTSYLVQGAVLVGMPQTTNAIINAGADTNLTEENQPSIFASIIPDNEINDKLKMLNGFNVTPAEKKEIIDYMTKNILELTDILINAGTIPAFNKSMSVIIKDNQNAYQQAPALQSIVEDFENYVVNKIRLQNEDIKNNLKTDYNFNI